VLGRGACTRAALGATGFGEICGVVAGCGTQATFRLPKPRRDELARQSPRFKPAVSFRSGCIAARSYGGVKWGGQ
jgi:hypothetical protein